MKQEKPLASSLCEYITGRLIRWHQNVKLIFWTKLAKAGLKQKSEHHNRILHIQKCVGTTFQLKVILLNFWTNLTQKGYFRFKKEKKENYLQILHILISPNFSSNYFDFLKQISQKRIFRLNTENMNNTIEFFILRLVKYQISA